METVTRSTARAQTRQMPQLTKAQRNVLDGIRSHMLRHGIMPTRTELAHALGLADASSVAAHLKRLAEAGWIELLPNAPRGIRLIDDDIPVIKAPAEVAAGTPIVCEAHIVQRLPAIVAEYFRPRPDYMLIVRGDSMDRTGVQDDDVIAVANTSEVQSGQVIVARFGDEVTLRRFVRIDDRHVELRPESNNPGHQVLKLDLAKHILKIDGVVVGVLIRRMPDGQTGTGGETQEGPHRLEPKGDI